MHFASAALMLWLEAEACDDMDAIALQLRTSQFAAFRRLSKAGHVLLGKIPTAIDDDQLDAVEEFQARLADFDRAIHEIERAGS